MLKTPLTVILQHKGHHVHSITPDTTVREAVRRMNAEKIGALLVMADNRPVGIFSERDVLTRVIDPGLDPEKVRVDAVMSTDVVAVKPSVTVDEAMRVITEKRHRHLPVYDGNQVVGMVSIGDLTRWLVREEESYIEDLLDFISGAYPR